MPIAVKTATALSFIIPFEVNSGIRLRAAPTAPNAVMGNAISSGVLKPNNHSNAKLNLLAINGKSPHP